MNKKILAIDQGTTSTRAILFNHDSTIFATSQKEFTQHFPNPGWVEHDANEIWLTTLSVMAEVILQSGISPKDIAAIGITNQRETAVVWDKNTGLPVYHAIVWQSRQSDEICQAIKQKGLEEDILKRTGLKVDPYFSASKIRWILDHIDNGQSRAENGELLFGTIDSWLVWKLSGNQAHITDVSNASRTLLYNIHERCWDKTLLEYFNIPECMLPEVKPSSYEYAKTAPYHFFNEEIPITAVIGDQQAALFGQGCFEKGMAKNTYGTGGFLLMNTGDEPIESKHGLVSTIAWEINGKVQYALEGSIFVCGSVIQWMRDGLGFFNDAQETEALATSVKDNGGVYIVPAFVGMGAPYWDDQCRGSIFGLTRGTTKAHLVRAGIEAMAYQSKDILDAMAQDVGTSMDKLRVDGGATRNNFLLQFQSDILQIPVERLTVSETTALGAAHLAGLAVGYWTMDELKATAQNQFAPQIRQEEADRLYEGWKKAVNSCIQHR